MDSILTTAITTAITELSQVVVQDAWDRLKKALKKKFGEQSTLPKTMEQIESGVETQGWETALKNEIKALGVDKDQEILQLAQELRRRVQEVTEINIGHTQNIGQLQNIGHTQHIVQHIYHSKGSSLHGQTRSSTLKKKQRTLPLIIGSILLAILVSIAAFLAFTNAWSAIQQKAQTRGVPQHTKVLQVATHRVNQATPMPSPTPTPSPTATAKSVVVSAAPVKSSPAVPVAPAASPPTFAASIPSSWSIDPQTVLSAATEGDWAGITVKNLDQALAEAESQGNDCIFGNDGTIYAEVYTGSDDCIYSRMHNPPDYSDLAYAVKVTIKSGGEAGEIFHLMNNTYYAFEIDTNGNYVVTIHDGGDNVICSGRSGAINEGPNQENDLGVIVQNNMIQLWINNQLVKKCSGGSSNYTSGSIATGVNATNSGSTTALFQDIQVWYQA